MSRRSLSRLPVRRSRAALGLAWLLVLLFFAGCSSGKGGDDGLLHDRLLVVRNSGIVELTFPNLDEQVVIPSSSDAIPLEPAVSRDGKRIAYTRQLVGVVIPGENTDLGSDIYVANIDGSDPRVAAKHAQRGDLLRSAAWLSDHDLLVSAQRFAGGTFIAEAVRVDINTNQRTTVLQNAVALDVSPDGSKIAYVEVDPSFLQSLWVANSDGSDPHEVAGLDDNFGTIASPRFSPDGKTIAFGAAAPVATGVSLGAPLLNGLPADIWTVSVDGTNVRPLVELKLDSPSLAWSGDGARLFVFAGDGLFVIDPLQRTAKRMADGTFHGQIDWLGTD